MRRGIHIRKTKEKEQIVIKKIHEKAKMTKAANENKSRKHWNTTEIRKRISDGRNTYKKKKTKKQLMIETLIKENKWLRGKK